MPDEVLVFGGEEIVIREVVTEVVEIGIQGPPGPPGPQGIPGSATGGALYYREEFLSPSATWTVNHNLGASPDVAVHSVGGAKVIASVTHTSVNQAVVSFESPFSGFVVCS